MLAAAGILGSWLGIQFKLVIGLLGTHSDCRKKTEPWLGLTKGEREV